MMTRRRLAEVSQTLEDEMVLSVYLARENEDPGRGPEWLRRLEVALGDIRAGIETRAPTELVAFDRAADHVRSGFDPFGRILPHEGWCALATEDRLWMSEPLSYHPTELVRWRKGAGVAPVVRALKASRPAVLAVLSSLHATLYRYENGELADAVELHAEWPPAEGGDVGISKRASRATGVRGTTRTDFVKRTEDENVRRHQRELEEVLLGMVGDDGVVVLGGTRKAVRAVRKGLEEHIHGRIAEATELAFDTAREDLISGVASAVSRLTEARQSDLLDLCEDPRKGSSGWNETYRALAAGAVDTLLLARRMIADTPDDAERLVRLAIAQGAELEELGGDLGERLMTEGEGAAARLRFVPASLMA